MIKEIVENTQAPKLLHDYYFACNSVNHFFEQALSNIKKKSDITFRETQLICIDEALLQMTVKTSDAVFEIQRCIITAMNELNKHKSSLVELVKQQNATQNDATTANKQKLQMSMSEPASDTTCKFTIADVKLFVAAKSKIQEVEQLLHDLLHAITPENKVAKKQCKRAIKK